MINKALLIIGFCMAGTLREQPTPDETLIKLRTQYERLSRLERRVLLLQCASEGKVIHVQVLIESKTPVNCTDQNKFTPLHLAVLRGDVEAVKLLLGRPDVMVNAVTSDGFTPLHFATVEGNVEVVKLLLGGDYVEVNLTANTSDTTGYTPLHCAAGAGHVEVVKLLLGRPDVKVKGVTSEGLTPLHCAAQCDHRDVCLCLLRYGLVRTEHRATGAQDILAEYTPLLNSVYSRLSKNNPLRALLSGIIERRF